MSDPNPFALPAGMAWLEYMKTGAPGTMIWEVMRQADSGDRSIAFIVREESPIIEALPAGLGGGVILEWRIGLLPVSVSSGRRVGFVPVMLRTPGGIAETNFNVLHLEQEDRPLLDQPAILILVGDRGSAERSVLFPNLGQEALAPSARGAIEIFEQEPWTDADYNEAKAIVERQLGLQELWAALGGRRG
jgi:hypothetical protein